MRVDLPFALDQLIQLLNAEMQAFLSLHNRFHDLVSCLLLLIRLLPAEFNRFAQLAAIGLDLPLRRRNFGTDLRADLLKLLLHLFTKLRNNPVFRSFSVFHSFALQRLQTIITLKNGVFKLRSQAVQLSFELQALGLQILSLQLVSRSGYVLKVSVPQVLEVPLPEELPVLGNVLLVQGLEFRVFLLER